MAQPAGSIITQSEEEKPVSNKPKLDVPAHLQGTLGERWRKFRKAWARCQRKLSEDSVHQLRVETRRLLALLELLEVIAPGKKVGALGQALRKLLKSFARLRDTQVQLLFLSQEEARFPLARRFGKALRRQEERLVEKLERRLRRANWRKIRDLASVVRRKAAGALETQEMRERGEPVVQEVVEEAFKRASALRSRVDPKDSVTIHRTRVAFKKYRYLIELLHPLLPWATEKQLLDMHEYQTMMGEVQDMEVMLGTLDEFGKERKGKAAGLGTFRHAVEERRAALIERYLAAADRLLSWQPPQGQ